MIWLEYLQKWTPLSGRVIKESGDTVNVADVIESAASDVQGMADAVGDATDNHGNVRTIETEHDETHAGRSFDFSFRAQIAGAATLYLVGRVGAKPVHFQDFAIKAASSPLVVSLLEGPTVTELGTPQPSRPRNRIRSSASTLAIYTGATVTDDGVMLFEDEMLGNATGQKIGGKEEYPAEWILRPSTDYAIKVTSGSEQAMNIAGHFFWYEPEESES